MHRFPALFFIGLTLFLSACNKYPEGPSFSLKSKTERVANAWKVDKYLENNVDKTKDFNYSFPEYVIRLTKKKEYFITSKAGNSLEIYGAWGFSSDKEYLVLNELRPQNKATTLKILKLYEKEMWLRDLDAYGKTIEYHLIPQ